MSFWYNLKARFSTFSIAEKVILINVICFLIPMLISTLFFLLKIPSGIYMKWFQLSPNFEIFITRPWTLISYSFFHNSFFHLLWNMLLLYYSSSLLLNLFQDRIFINNYFLGVLSGGIIFMLSYSLFPVFKGSYPPMIGASAGVMAVFIFICTYSPDQEMRIIFFNLKLKYLGLAFFFLDVIQIPYGNSGGHLAHIGGALLGFFYARKLSNGIDIGSGFEKLWKYLFLKNNLKTVYKSNSIRENSITKTELNQQKKIDSILDKISKSGYDSLSDEEKDFLFKAGKE